MSLFEVMAAPNRVLEVPMLDMVKGQQLPKGCVLQLKAEELVQANQVVSGNDWGLGWKEGGMCSTAKGGLLQMEGPKA